MTLKGSAMFETVKASPSVGLFGAWLAGITINEWAAIAGLVYTLCLIGEKVFRWVQAWRAKRK